jgi:hypothetical protein
MTIVKDIREQLDTLMKDLEVSNHRKETSERKEVLEMKVLPSSLTTSISLVINSRTNTSKVMVKDKGKATTKEVIATSKIISQEGSLAPTNSMTRLSDMKIRKTIRVRTSTRPREEVTPDSNTLRETMMREDLVEEKTNSNNNNSNNNNNNSSIPRNLLLPMCLLNLAM